MRLFVPVSLAGAATVVVWIALHNVRGRRRERELTASRGEQTATDFAALFESPSEQFIAEKLLPYLQMSTFTKQFAFRRDDALWGAPLNFVEDDVEDNLRCGFWDELDLGLTGEDSELARSLFSSATTVGQLVEAITGLYTRRYGSIEHRSR